MVRYRFFQDSCSMCSWRSASANTEMLRAGPPMLVRTKRDPLSSMSILNLGGMGGLRVADVVAGNMASISSFVIGVAGPSAGVSFRDALLTRPISFLTMNAPAPPMIVNIAQIAMTQFGSPMSMF